MLDPQSHPNEGIRYQKLGMLDEAVAEFRLAAAADDAPTVAIRLCREALAWRAGCRWDETLDVARRSARIARESSRDCLHAEALNAEAMDHRERGDLDALALLDLILGMPFSAPVRGLAVQNRGSFEAQEAGVIG